MNQFFDVKFFLMPFWMKLFTKQNITFEYKFVFFLFEPMERGSESRLCLPKNFLGETVYRYLNSLMFSVETKVV